MDPQVVVAVGGQPWEVSMFCANDCSGLELVGLDLVVEEEWWRILGLSAPSGICCGCGGNDDGSSS